MTTLEDLYYGNIVPTNTVIRYNKLRKLKKGKKIDTACMSLVE